MGNPEGIAWGWYAPSASSHVAAPPLLWRLTVLVVWCLRFLVDGHGLALDIKYVAVAGLLLPGARTSIAHSMQSWCSSWHPAVIFFGFLAVACLLGISLVSAATLWSGPVSPNPERSPAPYLLPCRTAHARLFPKKHAFSYSYLQIAIPIGWRGSVGRLVSVDEPTARTWFGVRAVDYLARGVFPCRTIDAAAHLFQDVDPEQYDAAWLVTAPRFLGYSFNPVSFWYLYQGDTLSAMILEVNNTFDERRMYFLPQSHEPGPIARPEYSLHHSTDIDGPQIATDSAPSSPNTISPTIDPPLGQFSAQWPKDFHVSPFNSRKGAYSLVAQPPSFAHGIGVANTITLSSSKHHAKLVARLFSTSAPIPIASLTSRAIARFLLQWCWVGFVTYPRILYEAARLFFRRRLHVWFRPEVTPASIGRNETGRERVMESCFRKFLAFAVAQQTTDKETGLLLRYVAAGNALPSPIAFPAPSKSPSTSPAGSSPATPASQKAEITFQVLTPRFYSAIATTPTIATYLKHNACGPVEQRTFTCTNLDGFLALLASPSQIARQGNEMRAFLAHAPPSLVDAAESAQYRRAIRALSLAERWAGGVPELLDFVLLAVRLVVAYWTVGFLVSAAAQWRG